MKLEIYQVGKVPPLTVVECDKWTTETTTNANVPILKCVVNIGSYTIRNVAVFNLNNIAGFKEVTNND